MTELQRRPTLPDDVRMLALAHLRAGERAAKDGALPEAARLLAAAWSLAVGRDENLANWAAWNAAWIGVKMGEYSVATEWFRHVTTPPSRIEWPHGTDSGQPDSEGHFVTQADQYVPAATLARRLTPPSLEVTNLGTHCVSRGGGRLPPCTSRKATALFRYLLTKPRREAHKEELMELLWPGARLASVAHSLHVIASTLRNYLDIAGSSYLLFKTDRYFINPEVAITDDCRKFLERIEAAEQRWHARDHEGAESLYSAAIEGYTGDYYVDNGALSWAVAEQEKVLTRFILALQRHGLILEAQRRYDQAIDRYQRLLERDPYREDIHCQIMLSYLALGRRGEAIQQYRRCCALLDADLGLEPMPETRALYKRVIENVEPEVDTGAQEVRKMQLE